MIDPIIDAAADRMVKSTEAFQTELAKLRTGRAHPSLLSHIKVDYYGSPTPLDQVAGVSVEDARTLTVTPWQKDMLGPVEKAIMTADLGLNPCSVGMVIRVPLPALTEERRRELVRVLNDIAEGARVSVRNARRDANQKFKSLTKEKEISEDDERQGNARIQKLTDKYVAEVDALAAKKEEDLMAV